MKIDHIQNNVAGPAQSDTAQRSNGKDPDNPPDGAQDKLFLSKFTNRIRQLAHQADAAGSVDLDRVNVIRQAIESGNYRISSAGIASGMLNPIQQAGIN